MEKLSRGEFSAAFRSGGDFESVGYDERVSKQATPYIFGSTVAGPLHIERGILCQDAHMCELLNEKVLAAVVADGLGSARKSDRGATSAVAAAMRALRAGITSSEGEPEGDELADLLLTAAKEARSALEELAHEETDELRAFACTLIVVVASENAVAVAHVGDGGVVAMAGQELRVVSGPGTAEYANEVVPLTSDSWEAALRISLMSGGIECLAVLTDGCQRAAFKRIRRGERESLSESFSDAVAALSGGTQGGEGFLGEEDEQAVYSQEAAAFEAFGGFFEPLFSFAREIGDVADAEDEIEALLSGLKMREHSEDDKTLVIGVFPKD